MGLIVKEPGTFGETLSRTNQRSFYGGVLSTDNIVGNCGLTPIPNEFSRESIQYDLDSSPPEGKYTVDVKQFNSCGTNANFVLKVVLGDKVIFKKTGVARKNSGDNFFFKFNISPCGLL